MPSGIACPGWRTDGWSCRGLQGAGLGPARNVSWVTRRPRNLVWCQLPATLPTPDTEFLGTQSSTPPFAVFRTAVLDATPRHAPRELVEEARLGLNRPGLRRPWDAVL